MNCKFCSEFITLELSFIDILSFKSLENPQICQKCREKFTYIDEMHCPTCYRQQTNSDVCSDCLRWQANRQPLINRALLQYDDAMRGFMQAYKYHYDIELAQLFKAEFTNFLQSAGAVVYVPIPVKNTERGFNQVTALINRQQIQLISILQVREAALNQKQAQRNRWQRVQSVQPFYLDDELISQISNQKIILIDDIYTTETTVRQAVELLAPFTNQQIDSYTLCR